MKKNTLADYEIRRGSDGKMGIYTRSFNVRCATFSANSHQLRQLLDAVIKRAYSRRGRAEAIRRASAGGKMNVLEAAVSEPRQFKPPS